MQHALFKTTRSTSNLNMQVKVAKDPAVADNLLWPYDGSLVAFFFNDFAVVLLVSREKGEKASTNATL